MRTTRTVKKGLKLKTLSKLKAEAWKLLSEIVRRTNADKFGRCRCVTCGVVSEWKAMHAGHAIGGRKASTLFDEDIIYPQCPTCNIWKGGAYGEFAAFLIRKHSLLWYEQKQEASRKVVKLTRMEVEDKIISYTRRLEIIRGEQH